MALLNKLKSLLGIGRGDADRERGDATVTVEREAADADQSAADADQSAADADRSGEEPIDADQSAADATDAVADGEPIATETDASASTGSLVSEPDDPAEAAEPAEAAGPESADRSIDDASDSEETTDEPDDAGPDEETSDAGPDEETSDAGPDEETSEADRTDAETAAGEPVQSIKGIGPAYGERLDGVGITSVTELANADAAELADSIDVPEKTVATWIDRASGAE
ncbi:MAG: helix-hairpin-helix domain-containing protein [Halobacteriota archaeon]